MTYLLSSSVWSEYEWYFWFSISRKYLGISSYCPDPWEHSDKDIPCCFIYFSHFLCFSIIDGWGSKFLIFLTNFIFVLKYRYSLSSCYFFSTLFSYLDLFYVNLRLVLTWAESLCVNLVGSGLLYFLLLESLSYN